MGKKIVLIIGGARSGKSSFALKEASKIRGDKAYIATAEALDSEMQERIERHRRDRGSGWDVYEEPSGLADILSDIGDRYSVVVIDCLTLWLSNVLLRQQNQPTGQAGTGGRTSLPDRQVQTTEKNVKEFINTIKQRDDSSVCAPGSEFRVLYIVSNEVGMGIVPDNELARRFRDLAGMLNQEIAELADEVYLVTAGIPIKIKSQK
jgi:adenosylcobinamide kinase/adenosylcobinamide-phosphate guanylyltransferase